MERDAMQVLYVVEFDVRVVAPVDGFDAALTSVVAWLNASADQEITTEALSDSGAVDLRRNRVTKAARSATWEVVGTDIAKALRVEVRDTGDDSTPAFVTRLTLGQLDGRTTLRISMARESSPTWLSPSAPAILHQPGVIRSFLGDERISLAIVGQVQDGRYLPVRSAPEVETLVDAIRNPARLPILLVHTRTLPALEFARAAAGKLVGLVRVVTLDYRAARLLDEVQPGYSPRPASALLIWSDPEAPRVPIDESLVNADEPETLRALLMRLLAPVSVLARGLDTAYRVARRAELAELDRAARARTAQAVSDGNVAAQLDALQDEAKTARENAEGWEEAALAEARRADGLQATAERVPGLEAQVEQLLVALQNAQSPAAVASSTVDPWSSVPQLAVGDIESAQNLYLHLEDTTERRIVFTDHAATTWKKSDYPFPDEMTECLVKLARVAHALYDGTDRSIGHLDTWIRDEFDLRVALQDDTIEKNAKLRDFEYERETHRRTPHVKVRDYTAPSQVGRIHFALDSDGRRLIVDHVGLKLY